MTPLASLRDRFMREDKQRKLGALASDINRLSHLYTGSRVNRVLSDSVTTELKLFSEWTAPDVSLAIQRDLLKLQRWLASMGIKQGKNLRKSDRSREASRWSRRMIRLSGLL